MNKKYNGNDIITKAIATLSDDQSQLNMVELLQALTLRLAESGEVIIPIEIDSDEIVHLTIEDVVKSKKDLKYRLRKVTLKNGQDAFTIFTNEDEVQKGSETSTLTLPINEVFERVLNISEVSGVLINPWSKSFFAPKDMISKMIEMANKVRVKNQIYLALGDISALNCECIVNAANSTLLGGGGVDGAIHRAAGIKLLEECKTLGGCECGDAKLTKGYNLKAKYVIHTVGPMYSNKPEDSELLRSCYLKSLDLARNNHIHTIAFPAISTGAYGYPMREATQIALDSVVEWFNANKKYGMNVIFCCYDESALDVYKELTNKGASK